MPVSKIIERIKGFQSKGLTENVVFVKSIKLNKMTPKKDVKFTVPPPKFAGLNAATIKYRKSWG